jgi:hypothetical protein
MMNQTREEIETEATQEYRESRDKDVECRRPERTSANSACLAGQSAQFGLLALAVTSTSFPNWQRHLRYCLFHFAAEMGLDRKMVSRVVIVGVSFIPRIRSCDGFFHLHCTFPRLS